MLMNAEPRGVSHGFETFVPVYRTEAIYGRLTKMTNNEIAARNARRAAVKPKSTQPWDPQTSNLQSNENATSFLQPSQNTGFHEAPLYSQARATSSRGAFDVRNRESPCSFSSARPSLSYLPYNLDDSYLNCVEPLMPSFNDHRNWPTNQDVIDYGKEQDRTCFGQASEAIEGKGYDSTAPPAAALSCIPATCSPCGSDLDSDRASSTVYSSYSITGDFVPDPMTGSLTSLGVQDDATEGWWDMGQHNDMPSMDSSTFIQSANGVPPPYMLWQAEPLQTLHYQSMSTIAPTALSLDDSTAYHNPLPHTSVAPRPASFTSSTTPTMYRSASSTATQSNTETNSQLRSSISRSVPSTATLGVQSSSQVTSHPRQRLSARAIGRPHVSILPSNDRGISKGKRRPITTKVSSQVLPKNNVLQPSTTSNSKHSKNTEHKKRSVSGTLEPKLQPVQTSHILAAIPNAAEAKPVAERESKDDFLVKSKRAGMSYKEIRQQGGFTEAESTLRGRYRTLTKDKEERVRRPMWKEHDIRLLKRAVRNVCNESNSTRGKIPWKQVANYISSHGGSYNFGYATCRKRWDELQECSSN